MRWCLFLCFCNAFLVEKFLSQFAQGTGIPSMWFASMWLLMFPLWPSFPQTLQTNALFCWGMPPCFPLPFEIIFSLFSIKEDTISSSVRRPSSDLTCNGLGKVSSGTFVLGVGSSNETTAIGFRVSASIVSSLLNFFLSLTFLSFSPCSLSSSARARNDSKSFWWTFTSPR